MSQVKDARQALTVSVRDRRRDMAVWAFAAIVFCLAAVLGHRVPFLAALAAKATIPFAEWIDQLLLALAPLKPAFRMFGSIISFPYLALAGLLHAVPYPVTILAAVLGGFLLSGGVAAFVIALALIYCLASGYWFQSMTTLSLVTVAIAYSAFWGFGLGIVGARSRRAKAILEPVLDVMQTIPTFAYLIPLLALFGFGPTVGLLASVIFAMPPMIRNTMLALERVPTEIKEAATMAGCTPAQRFWWAEIPAATSQILVGLNQTTMAAFAMVIIAALIGGFSDIGWEVLSNIRQARFGGSLVTGLLIVLLAVALDRLTSGAARHRQRPGGTWIFRFFTTLLAAATVVALVMTLFSLLPAAWPADWSFDAKFLDALLTGFVRDYATQIAAIKSGLLLYVLLPLKVGFRGVVMPSTWGFALTPAMVGIYWCSSVLLAITVAVLKTPRAGFWTLFAAILLLMGTTGLPWVAVAIALLALSLDVGGGRLVALTAGALAFIVLSGQWQAAAVSVYLCGVAVIASIVIGVPLGLAAAWSDHVSRIVRPICDFFQTIPQFVFLIPVLMLFGVGDFAGLVAITSYAVIPVIRYTEEGLRQVPPVLVEVARASGCTPRQSFLEVQLPAAKPVLLLGINQAILFSLGMLVVASLVGTDGLGQQIYIALSKNEPGAGLIAGIAMSLIGILADRIIRASIARA